MEIEQVASLQEAPRRAEASRDTREDLAPSQASRNAALVEAFSWGYSEWGHDLSEHSGVLFEDLLALGVPIAFAEAQGSKAGLVDKLYMRRDSLEHTAVLAILKWAKNFSYVVPQELILNALKDDDPKTAAAQVLADTLNRYPDLLSQIKGLVATAHANATAEGVTAAGSLLNHHKGAPVPSIPKTYQKERAQAEKSPAYGKGTDTTVASILAGLAGDLSTHLGALKNQGSSADDIKNAIPLTVSAGAGAAFYAGSSVHAFYAEAQKQHIADAGEKVDFVTAGDGLVCLSCFSAEEGNPWPVDSVPPIPNHGGCRCWYAAAGTI